MVEAGAEVVEVSCPHFVHALATYYLILPAEASSNLARFDAMRYGLRVLPEGVEAPSAEEVMRATREAGFGDEVKRRIILGTYALSSGYYDAYYGQAQKVRTLDQPRLRRGVRARRRAGLADRADDGVQARREGRRPAGDVPQRPGHDPGQPLRRPRHLGAERPGRRGRPARPASRSWRRRWPTTGSTASGAALEARAARGVGRRRCSTGPGLASSSRQERPHDRRRCCPYDEALARFDPALGPRGARRAEHRRRRCSAAARRSSAPSPTPRPARPAWGCRARCRWSTRWPSSRRSGSGWRSTARSRSGAGSRGRTTSTRTCRRTSRPPSTTSRSRSRASWTSGRGATARPSASRSSAPTWRRTPASRCTSAAPPAGSTAPTTRWSTTTGPASR